MADTKISAATLTTPAATDLIPMERPSSAVARYSTIAAVVQAQAASVSASGAVELATTAEAQAGADTARAVTPAGLAAYFDQTLLAGDAFKLKIPGQTRPEFFQLYTAEALFAGVYDPVAYWGFNVDGVGSRVNASLPAIYQQFEADYYVGGKHVQEWSFNCYPSTGSAQRYMAFVNNRDNYKETYWHFWVGTESNSFFNISDIETNTTLFSINAVTQKIYHYLDTIVGGKFEVNATGILSADNDRFAVMGTYTPSADFWPVKFVYSINPTANISTGAMLVQPTYTLPAGVAFNTVYGSYFYKPTITKLSESTLGYAYNILIGDTPTEAQYGNWAIWSYGRAGFGNGANFGGAEYDDEATDPVDIVTGTLRQRVAKTPATAGAAGRTGQICWDADYIYVCTATNTWKKVQIATW